MPSRFLPILVLLLAGLVSRANAGIFNPETFTLDNGLKVVVIANHRAPIVTHMVWYQAGAMDDPLGKSGVAHLFEHMMFKGTHAVPAGEFSKNIARLGGDDNAFTGPDFTAYHQTITVDRLPLVMKMEADRMANLALAKNEFAAEHKVVLEERLTRYDNDPAMLLDERMDSALFQLRGRPVIGFGPELASLTRDDVKEHYRRWYAPNNAVVVVSGDVTVAQVKPLAEQYYGKLKSRNVPAHQAEPARSGGRVSSVITLRHPQIRQPVWRRVYAAPSYGSGDKKKALAIQLLSEILGNGSTSRLYRQLVMKDQIASAVGTGYDAARREQSSFALYALPRDGHTLPEVEKALGEVVAQLLREGLIDDELAKAKQRLLAGLVYLRDNPETAANIMGQMLACGLSIADVENWPESLQSVSEAEVMAAARQIFNDEPSVTGLLLPGEGG